MFNVSRTIYQIEGIVVEALPFKERDYILTLFTPGGLFKLYAKGRKNQYNPLTSPLTRGEYLYLEGKKDLHLFQEGSILSQNLKLRDRYENLEAAEKLKQAILQSQWPGKPSPLLYTLFSRFLELLPSCTTHESVLAVFYLKTLKHEGIFQIEPLCSACEKKGGFREGGESYCEKHASPIALPFSEEEQNHLQKSWEIRSLQESANLRFPPPFCKKVETLFSQIFSFG
ncbi:MAG: DNA repair protein RecO [Chlamydiae bacterium]|nr:DNA repair protein RecO [Chlamydiota bacterium]